LKRYRYLFSCFAQRCQFLHSVQRKADQGLARRSQPARIPGELGYGSISQSKFLAAPPTYADAHHNLAIPFGLVSIPVKLYAATESSSDVRFNLLAPDGSRVKQQYVSEKTGAVVERSSMNKGYEFNGTGLSCSPLTN
jgi:hypothetical protein